MMINFIDLTLAESSSTATWNATSYPGSFHCHHFVSKMSLGTRLFEMKLQYYTLAYQTAQIYQ